MSIGFFAFRRSVDSLRILLGGFSVALACALLAPSLASARPFAPQMTVDIQSADADRTANIVPQMMQGLTRYPSSVTKLPGVSEPYEYGEQGFTRISFVLPKRWRTNGEAMMEPCDLLSHLVDNNGNGPDVNDPFDPDKGTPCSEAAPTSLMGTVDAKAWLFGSGYPTEDPSNFLYKHLQGKVYFVRSDQYFAEPGLGNHGPGSPQGDWSKYLTGDASDKGNALPVMLVANIDPIPIFGNFKLPLPPIYMANSVQADTLRIHSEIGDVTSGIEGLESFASAYVGSMQLTLNPDKSEGIGMFRTPPRDACSSDQLFDYSAESYADGENSKHYDGAQRYPDEGTLPISTPPLTGCDSPPDPFDSLKISKVESSTTDAGANPALTLTMTRASGDAFLKGMKMTLPEGMIGSPYAASELCSDEQAQQDQCPAGSRVGSASTEVSVFETRQIRIDGDVYQAPTTGSELARFLTVLRTGPIADEQIVVLPAYMYLLPGAKGIVADVPSMPVEFDVRKAVFSFDGSTGAANKHPLLINPTSCNSGDITVDFTSEMDQTYAATAPYQATNCDKLPFDPSLDVKLSCNAPHCLPSISMTITQPYGDAAMSGTKVTIPGSYILNLGSQVQPCSLADQAAETCPADSLMGNAVIESPLAIEPLQGEIFLAEPAEGDSDVFRRIHIRVTGLIDMSMDGDLKSNPDGGFDTVISGIPQVPIAEMQLNINGGENALVYTPYQCGTDEFKAEFTSHAGQTVSKSSAPETSGADCAPRLSASVSPRRAGARSKLTLNVRPNAGTVLKSAKFDLGSLKVRGLGRSRSSREVGKLTLTPKAGKRSHSKLVTKGGRKITAKPGKGSRGTLSTRKTKMSLGSKSLSVKGLPDEVLSELDLVFNSKRTRALRNPKKCGKVKIVGRFVDTKGQTYETATKARIGCTRHRR